MARLVFTSIALRGSKPKLLRSERANPRTATREEVTSTAQIAICAASSRSRTVIRRPTVPVDPAFTIWYGLARSTWRTGTMPKRNPLTSAKAKAMALVMEASRSGERDVPDYVEIDHDRMKGRFIRAPKPTDVPFPVSMEPNLVIEFYSR